MAWNSGTSEADDVAKGRELEEREGSETIAIVRNGGISVAIEVVAGLTSKLYILPLLSIR